MRTLHEAMKLITEKEDLKQTEKNIKNAIENSDEDSFSINTIHDNLNVLVADEEAAIDGYNRFLKQVKDTIEDKDLIKAIEEEINEIINDEKEHIEKLNVIKNKLKE